MGRDKAWIEVEGRSLVDRVLAVAGEVAPVGGLVVSSRQADSNAYLKLGRERAIPLLPDRVAGLGPLGGLATALEDAGSEATVLLLAVDLPYLTKALLLRLLSVHWRVGSDLTLPLDAEGRPQPLTACYEGRLAPLVGQLLARGERRLRALHSELETLSPSCCCTIPYSAFSDLSGAERLFLNCNRQEDLPPPSEDE